MMESYDDGVMMGSVFGFGWSYGLEGEVIMCDVTATATLVASTAGDG